MSKGSRSAASFRPRCTSRSPRLFSKQFRKGYSPKFALEGVRGSPEALAYGFPFLI